MLALQPAHRRAIGKISRRHFQCAIATALSAQVIYPRALRAAVAHEHSGRSDGARISILH
jgi:hypothetical protein